MMRLISLGAGVQSSTMALMFADGELKPMPDGAIFADTGGEPNYVYEWLNWLETKLPFPVHRVMWKDGLTKNIKASIAGQRFAGAPFYTEPLNENVSIKCDCQLDDSGEVVREPLPGCQFCAGNGLRIVVGKREGQLRRQCTREFKVQPITQKLRELVGLEPRQRAPKGEILVTQYIGISFDEVSRMRDSQSPWIRHEWPLVDLRMHRQDCLNWMTDHGLPKPGRSACVYCPYHSDHEWHDLKANHPESFQEAVEIDKLIRAGVRGTTQKLYLHRKLQPIDEIKFNTAEAVGQADLFNEDCEGMCGV